MRPVIGLCKPRNATGWEVGLSTQPPFDVHSPTDIWVMECDGLDCNDGDAIPLMEDSHPLNDSHPVWSPSGSVIAFVSDRAMEAVQEDDDLDIWIMNANGDNKTNITYDYSDEDNDPDWGPAGL